MTLLDFSIYPLDKGDSLSPYVARCLDIVDRSGVDYRCHAMGTTLEGEFDRVIEVVRQCFHALEADCHRIECSIKIDHRPGPRARLDRKVASVEEKLGRSVNR